MKNNKDLLISDEDFSSFRRHGFIILRNVINPDIIRLGKAICERWANWKIEQWIKEGLLDKDYGQSYGFWEKYMMAYRDAGYPHHRRNPNYFCINEEMYMILRSPILIDIAKRLLGTAEIAVHGIFNARPQVPDRSWDSLHTTPWHQDGQFRFQDYGEGERDLDATKPVITMWFPLQDVDVTSGCLQVFSIEETQNKLFEPYRNDFERTGTVGLSPDECKKYTPIPLPMKLGDIAVFGQRTPHAAVPMMASHTRWSIDVRYEAAEARVAQGKRFGFIANSDANPSSVTSLDEWILKRSPLPAS